MPFIPVLKNGRFWHICVKGVSGGKTSRYCSPRLFLSKCHISFRSMASRDLPTIWCDHVFLDIQVNTLLYSSPKKDVLISQLGFSDDQFRCFVRFSLHRCVSLLTGLFTYGLTEHNNATICTLVRMIIMLGYQKCSNMRLIPGRYLMQELVYARLWRI